MSCGASNGRELLEVRTWFVPTWSQVLFPFADSALRPFAIISHRCKYDYIVSPLSESSNLGMLLGTSQHRLSL